MPLNLQYTFLLIAAGALFLPQGVRRVALVGLVPLGLSIAATTVRLGGSLAGLSLRAAEQSAPLRFLQINTGLALLGVVLVMAAVIRALRTPTAWITGILVVGGVAPIVAAHWPLLAYIGWLPIVGAAIAIAAGAVTFFHVGRLCRISRVIEWFDRRLLERNQREDAPVVRIRTVAGWIGALVLLWFRATAPDALDLWAPLFMPLVILSVWHVAAVPGSGITRPRRMLEMLIALSSLGFLAGGAGGSGAYWLLGASVLVAWKYPVLDHPPGRLLLLPMIWGALLVITGGLAVQVTYSVLAAAGIAVALWVYPSPE